MEFIDSYFSDILGDFVKKQLPLNSGYSYYTAYFKPLFTASTIDMVIISPFNYELAFGDYLLNEENCFYFFIYDNETDLIIGDVVRIDYEEDWKDELSFYIYTAEERLDTFQCPKCSFWLIQRTTKHGHEFIGCSGFPDCDYSNEIDKFIK